MVDETCDRGSQVGGNGGGARELSTNSTASSGASGEYAEGEDLGL